jgi:hypothetical protein
MGFAVIIQYFVKFLFTLRYEISLVFLESNLKTLLLLLLLLLFKTN